MKVIVAGMAKTGTKSMNQALTRLGYKVYDVLESCFYHTEEYRKIVDEGWTTEDFQRMFLDVDAIVDFPAYFFWDEIHKAFPDAKIILTMRENEDVWAQSYARQMEVTESSIVFNLMHYISPSSIRVRGFRKKLLPMATGVDYKGVFGRKAHEFNQDMLKRMYRAHNAYVLHSAPKDKLLVFNCTEGWEPLCDFLGVPVPNEPFPHRNKKGEFGNEVMNHPIIKKKIRELMAFLAIAAIFVAVIICSIWTA